MSRPNWSIVTPTSEEELNAFARVAAESFGSEASVHRTWLERVGAPRLRIARTPEEPCGGGLGVLSLGLWLGGREISCAGITMVAVAPHARGGGLAKALMKDALTRARAEGAVLSALYPATLSVYRAVGYGQAGLRVETRVPLQSLGALAGAARELPVRRFREADRSEVAALYDRVAAGRTGWLRRDPYVWSRVSESRAGVAERYVLGPEGGPIEGHLGVLRVNRADGLFHDLLLTDVSLDTPRAVQRMWSFLASHGSMAREVVLPLEPAHPALGLLPEPTFHSTISDAWMLRVLDPVAALLQRAWPPGARGRIGLALEDPLFPENEGRWELTVEDGEAQVVRGGDGGLRLDMPGLASLYTGFRDVTALTLMGRAEVRDPELGALATRLFRSPIPHLPDRF